MRMLFVGSETRFTPMNLLSLLFEAQPILLGIPAGGGAGVVIGSWGLGISDWGLGLGFRVVGGWQGLGSNRRGRGSTVLLGFPSEGFNPATPNPNPPSTPPQLTGP